MKLLTFGDLCEIAEAALNYVAVLRMEREIMDPNRVSDDEFNALTDSHNMAIEALVAVCGKVLDEVGGDE